MITVLALSAAAGVYLTAGFAVVAVVGWVAHRLRHEEPYELVPLYALWED